MQYPDNFLEGSGTRRHLKILQKEAIDNKKAEYYIKAVQAYIDEVVPRIEIWARQILAYVAEGDMLRTQLAGVKKLARCQPVDGISLKKSIADRIIELESYPFVTL